MENSLPHQLGLPVRVQMQPFLTKNLDVAGHEHYHSPFLQPTSG
jgi:hypothetical protein